MKKKDLAVLEVLPNPEIQQQVRQPDYQIFESKIVHWLNLFIIISQCILYTRI